MITEMHEIVIYRDDEDGLKFAVPLKGSDLNQWARPRVMLDASAFRRWLKRNVPEVATANG